MMRWLPTEDWSGRSLICGGAFALIGVVFALSAMVAPPHALFRTIAAVSARVAFGTVVPAAAAVITLLIAIDSPRQLVTSVWVLCLVLFVVLLTVAGRGQMR
jgi:Ca2+/Na+ antiporter